VSVVRFMAHAGSDAEVSYGSSGEITADYERDPLLGTARLLVAAGLLTPAEVVDRYEAMRARVRALADDAVTHRRLASGAEIAAPLAPRHPDHVARRAAQAGDHQARAQAFGDRPPEAVGQITLADSINCALADALASYPHLLVFGEDVERKGGVYGVTRGLTRRFGAGQVFERCSMSSRSSVLGSVPESPGCFRCPEIQYLAYLHNAEDQLRGEAASLQFFSTGQFRNPMVVRVAGLAYQKGFGGHFHNDNAVAVLRDIPGLVVAVPARGDDAAAMLRTCLAAADIDGANRPRPHLRRWLGSQVGDLRQRGSDVSLRVTRRLAETGIGARVLDLRWLAPLPLDDLLREARRPGGSLSSTRPAARAASQKP
jgi:2-oxoisovalerate dehydrogenase E1 component